MAAMTTSILEALTRTPGSATFAKAATAYGESGPAITKAFTVAVASVLAPLVTRAGDAAFTSDLLTMVKDVPADVTLLDDPDRLFNRPVRPVEETGPIAMLRSLVFGGNTLTITDAIAKASGVRPATAASLFSAALPTVLGYLSRIVARENLDAAGLASRLAAERTPVAAVLPANLGSLLSGGDDSFRIGVRTPPAERLPYDRAAVMAEPAGKLTGRWIAVSVVGLIGIGAWYALSGRPARAPEGTPGAIGTAGEVVRVLPDGTSLRFPAESTETRLLAAIEQRVPVDRGAWYELDRITFDTDAATLRPQSREQLSNIAAILAAYPSVHVTIGGYTDNSGDAAANQRLSQSRAESVMSALGTIGVAANRIAAEGYGAQHPIADNATADGRARNRRVSLRATAR
jgi:OOP family OmpA-OmpF porin